MVLRIDIEGPNLGIRCPYIKLRHIFIWRGPYFFLILFYFIYLFNYLLFILSIYYLFICFVLSIVYLRSVDRVAAETITKTCLLKYT